MGERGPVPKRSTERRRRNVEGKVETVAAPAAPVDAPPTPADLHPIASRWFVSLASSGQARFYEPSDWAAAELVACEMSRLLSQRFSAQGFAAVWSAMTELLTTEGSRRRVRLEVERSQEKPAVVAVMDDYRDALG